MKIIKSIIDFLTFNWTKNYKITIPILEFLTDLKSIEYKERNLEGEITDSSFELFYISDFALKFPTKIPFLEIKGKLKKQEKVNQLKIRVSIQPFVKYIFIIAVVIVLTFFFIDKYSASDFGNFSNSNLPLILPIFAYGFLMLNFITESVSCKDYFSRLIVRFEKNKNY